MFQFAWPYLIAALPLPLLALLLPPARPRPGAALRVPFFGVVQAADRPGQGRRSWPRLLLALLAWLLLVTAAVRPQWQGEPVTLPISGRDLLLAIDISRSMETADMLIGGEHTTRISVVKAVAGEFIERRRGDRLGLILFGRNAYLQVPLTFDRATVRTLLYEAEAGLAGNETAIGDAIGLAVKRLRDRPQDNRVLVLLTDGVNNAGSLAPLQAAELAATAGLKIYTIGVGADELIIRDFFGTRPVNPSSDLDETTLTAIAERTGGRYFRARDTAALRGIYGLLDRLEPLATDNQTYRPVRELYPWPLALALLLSAALAMTTRCGARRSAMGPRWREARR